MEKPLELEEMLEPYFVAINRGILDENWILSVMATLTLPDICVSLERLNPKDKTNRSTYVNWFDTYVTEYKTTVWSSKSLKMANTLDEAKKAINNSLTLFSDIEEEKLQYFNGVNAYALRCAILHNGDGEVGTQSIYDDKHHKEFTLGIKKVKFETITDNLVFSQFETTAVMNPKVFCEAILAGFLRWTDEKKDEEHVLENARNIKIFEWIHI